MDPSVSLAANLALLADSLQVPKDVETRGNLLLDRILKTVCAKSKFKVHRVAKAGSLGKKTAINIKVDFDCVFFLNAASERDAFMDDLEDILTLHLDVEEHNRTVNSIGFQKDGFLFDFLPGEFVCHSPEEQVQLLLQGPADKPGPAKVGLVEGTVIFMKEQSGFFNGRSYTLELFAVMAAEELMRLDGGENLLRGLRVALDKIRNYRRIKQAWNRFYRAEDARLERCVSKAPYLIDVSDPGNNLLEPDRHRFFDKLGQYAETTLSRLDALSRGVPEQLVNLFDPQPSVWRCLRNVPQPDSFLVGQTVRTGEAQLDVVAPPCIKREMELVGHALAAMIQREYFFDSRRDGEQPRPQEVAQKCVSSLLGGGPWSPTLWDSRQVVLTIPVNDEAKVLVGFDTTENKAFDPAIFKEAEAYWDAAR